MSSVSTRLLGLWLLCVVAGTLAPFRLATDAGVEHGLKVFEYGPHGDPIHFLLNILLFVPFGVLLHQEGRRRSGTLLPIVILAGMFGMSLSMTIEYIQAFLPNRDSSLVDVLANTAGSLLGVAAGHRWGALAATRLARLRIATSPGLLAGLIGSFLVVALLVSGTLQAATNLSNWSPDYPLLVGNEQTGDRPWRGRVFSLDISDVATPAASVRRFAAGEPVSLPAPRIATFTFGTNAPYKDGSGTLPDLEWTGRPDSDRRAGVSLTGRSWLQSDRAASGLALNARKTNAFTLLVRCATDDVHQNGPARIISNSVSPLLRNFTLGQEGGDLVFRLRTPANGLNGSLFEIHAPGIFVDRQVREILVTYDGATLLVAAAHSDKVSSTKLTPGSNAALALSLLDDHPEELDLYEMAYVAAISLIPGALIGVLGHTHGQRLLFSVAWALSFAVLLEMTLVRVSGRAFEWNDLVETAGISALVLTVFNVIFSPAPDLPWRRPAPAGADLARRVALDEQRNRSVSRAAF